jgi:signal transduction histidine kinase
MSYIKPITALYGDNQPPRIIGYKGTRQNNEDGQYTRVIDLNNKPTMRNADTPNDRRSAWSFESAVQSIVHEIRNPLTAISLANQSLNDEAGYVDPSLQVFTDIVAKNIDRIETILRELLHVNEPGNCGFAPMDICDVIEKSLQRADDRVFLKKVKVVKSYGFDLLVNGDGEKLGVVFLNIIINALEAVTERGKLWITVYKAKDEIKVVFKDNGSGMDGHTTGRMFDRNFSRKPNGTGVGLATAKEILERHGANIEVNSEVGSGTTIVISFKGHQMAEA